MFAKWLRIPSIRALEEAKFGAGLVRPLSACHMQCNVHVHLVAKQQ